jgi:hypothetical protein
MDMDLILVFAAGLVTWALLALVGAERQRQVVELINQLERERSTASDHAGEQPIELAPASAQTAPPTGAGRA